MKNDEVIVDIVKSMKKSVDEFVEYVETIISVYTATTWSAIFLSMPKSLKKRTIQTPHNKK